jgi:hypothetical protein
LGDELKSVSEQCRVTTEEAGGHCATGIWVCDLTLSFSLSGSPLASQLEAIPSWLGQAAKGAVVTHYDGVDLQSVHEGFWDSQTNEELNALEWVAALATDALARLVQLNTMLHGHEEK